MALPRTEVTAANINYSSPQLQGFSCLASLTELAVTFDGVSSVSFESSAKRFPVSSLDILITGPNKEQFRQVQRAIFESAVSLVLHESPDDPQKYVTEVLGEQVPMGHSLATRITQEMLNVAPKAATQIREFRLLADRLVPLFIEEAENDTGKSYQLAQVLAKDPREAYSGNTAVHHEELFALLWASYAAQNNYPDPHQTSSNKFKEGIFDVHLTEDVFFEMTADYTDTRISHDRAGNLAQFINILKETFKLDKPEIIHGMARNPSFTLWLPQAFEEVDKRRDTYIRRLGQYGELRRTFLRNTFLTLPHTNLNKFKKLVTNLDKLVPNSTSTRGQSSKPSKASEIAARAVDRSSAIKPFAGTSVKTSDKKLVDREQERARKRPLKFVNSVGTQFEEGSKEFKRFIKHYLDKHDGDGNRILDVESALQFLSSIDFSQGKLPGVIQLMGQRITYSRTGEKLPVYELKPKEAGSANSTQSVHGDKLRVDFTILPNGEVAILKIYDRSMMVRVRRAPYHFSINI